MSIRLFVIVCAARGTALRKIFSLQKLWFLTSFFSQVFQIDAGIIVALFVVQTSRCIIKNSGVQTDSKSFERSQ